MNVSGFLLGLYPANNSQKKTQDKIKCEEKEKTCRRVGRVDEIKEDAHNDQLL